METQDHTEALAIDDQAPEEHDFTSYPNLNGRELAQMICGTISGRASAAGEQRFRLSVGDAHIAAVLTALVGYGWAVRRVAWGFTDNHAVLEAWSGD